MGYVNISMGQMVVVVITIAMLAMNVLAAERAQQAKTTKASENTVTLRPKMRSEPLFTARYHIKTKDLLTYIHNMVVFDHPSEAEWHPYVLGYTKNRIIGSKGDTLFVKGIGSSNITTYLP